MFEALSGKVWEKFFSNKSAVWAAIFSGVLTISTIQLVCLNKKQIATSIATQRAFINFYPSPQGVKVVDQSTKVVGIQFLIGWQNSGTTPSKSAVGRANRQIWPADLPDSFDFKDLATAKGVPTIIGPKVTAYLGLLVPIEDLMDLQRRHQHLYFWGWMAYRDIFPGTPMRLTEFCAEVANFRSDKQDLTDASGNFNWDMQACPVSHDCFDEECKDYKERVKQSEAGLS